ncbi:MAG: UDP-N-acetylmuramoylalanyl-D-glutamate--2,6-diaminopimelate ligase [Coxiella sp. DG_40]|nr:MAG: UDP-N-acetylmuramoylalanyl-D-glutamate--2,6-diaminopimelate ligase [Coxiella sp. DG_40]
MLLSNLLKELVKIDSEFDREIIGLTTDSRSVRPGFLFAAFPGINKDARDYIANALANGASAIVCEAQDFNSKPSESTPIIALSNLRKEIGNIAATFYGHPACKMTIIGFTGTNGKTSCSQFLAKALQLSHIKCGVIGTLGSGFPDELNQSVHTTPDSVSIQQQLFMLQQQGAKVISMEVSSHGLEQERVNGIDFDVAVFTNLTRDHLDYHKNMEHYAAAKRRFFMRSELKHAVVNIDDNFGRLLLNELSSKLNVIAYGISGVKKVNVPMVKAEDIKLNQEGFAAKVVTPWGEGELKSRLLGRFNISNLLAVLSVLNIMEVPLSDALASIAELDTVPGRMQTFGGGDKPMVVVDFAHTPDALQQALVALREYCSGALWCVFGCGGDRDRGKRPQMAIIAEQFSDRVIITNDNPRCESPKQIVSDIIKGLSHPQAVEIEYDRRVAIADAINSAKVDDVILIAGKGHEPYQIIGEQRIPYSDIEEVKKLMATE